MLVRNSISPDIDVVIPTLNSSRLLGRCLGSLSSQEYPGTVRTLVIDGGSNDDTLDVATSFGAEVHSAPRTYGTGLDGARHIGERLVKAPLVWILDSDNVLVERTAARDLVAPFNSGKDVQLSVPFISSGDRRPYVNRWLALVEGRGLQSELARAVKHDDWYFLADLSFGISNGTIIRSTALRSAVGYDSDVRLLSRLRRLGLARAALVPNAHYLHFQADSLNQFRSKIVRRLLKFAKMTDEELSSYFVEYPVPTAMERELRSTASRSLVRAPLQGAAEFLRTGDPAWLIGLLFPGIMATVFVANPVASMAFYSRFL